MFPETIAERFRSLYASDAAHGRVRSLSAYQRVFKGFEDVVAREFAALEAARPAGAPPRATPQPQATAPPAGAGQEPKAPPRELPEDLSARLAKRRGHDLTGLGEIARGGMGAVLRVRDEVLSRDLAMKVILEGRGTEGDDRTTRRFVAEAQVTAQLAHPGVVPVHELGADADGRLYFTMALVQGETLASVIEKARAGEAGWTTTRALQVILRVCETVAFAHSRGVIHRDIKPDNVMVGEFGVTYLMDWGLAKSVGAEDAHDIRVATVRDDTTGADCPLMTMDGSVIGTPAYMPPEQALGRAAEVDMRSDVYAIGALLYELLTGEAPYVRHGSSPSPVAVLTAVATGPPSEVHAIDPSAPEELSAICEKAMSRDALDRYASAADLAEELQRYLGGHVVRAHRTGAIVEMRKWVARNKAVASTAAAALIALAAVSAVFMVSLKDERDRARVAEGRADVRADEAVRAREATRERARDARAAGLAAASSESVATDQMLSLLLAREAVRTRATPATVSRLRAAIVDSPMRAILRGHDFGPARTVAWSPDGSRILTSAGDGTARLWDPAGREVAVLRGHESGLLSAAFSADGSRIVTAAIDGTARIWDAGGRELAVLRGHQARISSAVFSPDGSRVATASSDRTARVWDASGGKEIAKLDGHRGPVWVAAFTPDGERVLTASEDGTARLWDCAGKELAVLRGHQGPVRSAAVSPDGSRFVTASTDDTGRIWDSAGAELAVLRGHTNEVRAIAFSRDGLRVATGSSDGTARTWDLSGRTTATLVSGNDGVRGVQFSPDGSRVLTLHYSDARIWDAAGKELVLLRAPPGPVWSGAFSPDGSRVVTAYQDGTGRVWDLTPRETAGFRAHDDRVRGVAQTSDGSRFATASDDGLARVWDAEGRLLAELAGHEREVFDVAFSPDGTRVATASGDGTARLWDARGRELAVLRGHEGGAVTFVTWTEDGARIVTAGSDGTVRLWDAAGTEIAVCRSREQILQWAAVSPDGSRIAASTADNALQVWDAAGNEVAVLSGHTGVVKDAEFSPDGSRIVTASDDRTARLWDGAGNQIAVLAGHDAPVSRVRFSGDGKRIVTASDDGEVRIRDASGEILAGFRCTDEMPTMSINADASRLATVGVQATRLWDGQGRAVCALPRAAQPDTLASFSPDGLRLVTGGLDGRVRVCVVRTEDLLALADVRCTREFFGDERARYESLLTDD